MFVRGVRSSCATSVTILRRSSSRRAKPPAIWLNARASSPISSCEAMSTRCSRSPAAMCRAASVSASTGPRMRRDSPTMSRTAPVPAPRETSSKVRLVDASRPSNPPLIGGPTRRSPTGVPPWRIGARGPPHSGLTGCPTSSPSESATIRPSESARMTRSPVS